MLLAIDTSTQWMGLALFDGIQVVCETIWRTHSHHTIELAPAIQQLMARCAVQPGDLEALGVALGPGSFTSLRIGLAVAKGMALALHLPLVGVPTLDILASQVPTSDLPLVTLLQAGRGRLAVNFYTTVMGSGWQSHSDAKVMTVDELSDAIRKPTLVWGELSAHERQVLARKRKNVVLASPAQALRRPSYLAEMAWHRYQLGKTDEVVSLAPIYLHVAEAIPD